MEIERRHTRMGDATDALLEDDEATVMMRGLPTRALRALERHGDQG
jgi:hypothetical protein